ncbi:MAG TPA: DivIVA domain-containing protein [Solirubrobacteraceae bacterium]|jgi:DivIVA domain-containing protein|nr:DivIVA domain-containing protein [Solirubrobacteraceae bacterium]
MSAVELDRQGIERRDFPIVRRGYDPASVDAHLRALAAEIEQFQHEASSRGGESLAATAATQVQGILEAAQATAEAIEHQAAEQAHQVREAADADARRTREEAVARAREHVAVVSHATEALLGHVASLDGETRTLIDSLRSGAGRLAGDLSAVEGEMEALYDAASGRAATQSAGESAVAAYGDGGQPVPAPAPATHNEPFVETPAESHAGMQGDPYAQTTQESAAYAAESFEASAVAEAPQQLQSEPAFGEQPLFSEPAAASDAAPAVNGDLDGARLVALNMALNGDSREDTARYLAENFAVPDRERLLDEVYAAIEGE